MDDLSSLISIRNPEIDVEAVLARVRARLQQRRAMAANSKAGRWPVTSVSPSQGQLLEPEIYAALAEAQAVAEEAWVTVNVRDERLPLVNALWNRLKTAFHEVIVLYVNGLAGRQTTFNVAATRLIVTLIRSLEERDRRLQSLEDEVRELRAQYQSLQAEAHRRGEGA